jgi:hypothetical protein
MTRNKNRVVQHSQRERALVSAPWEPTRTLKDSGEFSHSGDSTSLRPIGAGNERMRKPATGAQFRDGYRAVPQKDGMDMVERAARLQGEWPPPEQYSTSVPSHSKRSKMTATE